MAKRSKYGYEVRPDNLFPCFCLYDGFDDLKKAIGGTLERIPYPSQYGRKGLWVYADENGINKGLPYNRWGLVGTFCVVKKSADGKYLEIPPDVAEEVAKELLTGNGYLDAECLTDCRFREPFAIHGEPPLGAVPRAGRWFN